MRKISLLIAMSAFFLGAAQVAPQKSPVIIQRGLLDNHYPTIDGKKVSTSFARDYMKDHPEAYTFARRAKVRRDFSLLFGIIGAANALGLYSNLANGDQVSSRPIIGALGSIGLAYGLTVSYRKNLKRSVDLFNESLNPTSTSARFQSKFEIAFHPTGLVIKF